MNLEDGKLLLINWDPMEGLGRWAVAIVYPREGGLSLRADVEAGVGSREREKLPINARMESRSSVSPILLLKKALPASVFPGLRLEPEITTGSSPAIPARELQPGTGPG